MIGADSFHPAPRSATCVSFSPVSRFCVILFDICTSFLSIAEVFIVKAESSSSNEISFPMAARRETTPMTSSPSSSASGPSQINQVLPNTAKKSPETNKTATQDKWILQNNYTWETIEGTPNSLLVETTKQLKEAENSVISLRQQLHINDNNFSCMRDQIEQCIENNLQCNICYEMFIEPTVLNCSHTFCLECIESWTREANHCPTCRAIVINKSHCRTLDTYLDKISEYLSSEIKTRRESLKVERNNNKVEVNRNPRNNARINHRHQVFTLVLGAEFWNELNQVAAERGITPEEALLDPILMGNAISRHRNSRWLASHLNRHNQAIAITCTVALDKLKHIVLLSYPFTSMQIL
ncbi:uncharacterized protein LOC113558277 [Rhopalosiphum maidis]|uniref:uncharacterized protein LOC113558277 n=1 Tax=Rhopalosiphum maidis TaxID=43146 RepID=UPI000F00E9E0|nr:uncharacterized protein LOC113558277 [Rhopalosiphum maidis]